MFQGIHILDIYGAVVGTVALLLAIWQLRIAQHDLRVDIDDFNQDNPHKKGKYDKEESNETKNTIA